MVDIGSESEEKEKTNVVPAIVYEHAPRMRAPDINAQQALAWCFRQAWSTYHKQVKWIPKSPAAKEIFRSYEYLNQFTDDDVQDLLSDARVFLKAKGII